MPAAITVKKESSDRYQVTVSDAEGRSTHRVILAPDYHSKLTAGKATPEDLIRRSFEFLLEREPKESILEQFDLPVIARYFPDYEREIGKRLS